MEAQLTASAKRASLYGCPAQVTAAPDMSLQTQERPEQESSSRALPEFLTHSAPSWDPG